MWFSTTRLTVRNAWYVIWMSNIALLNICYFYFSNYSKLNRKEDFLRIYTHSHEHTLTTHSFCRTQKESQRKPIFGITEMERTPYPMSRIWQGATLLQSNMAGMRFHTPPTASMHFPVEMPANALWQVSYRCLCHTPFWPFIVMYCCSLLLLLVSCGLLLYKNAISALVGLFLRPSILCTPLWSWIITNLSVYV